MKNIYKKSIIFIGLFIILITLFSPTVHADGATENIEFKDSFLKQQILENNDINEDGEISKEEMEQIDTLVIDYTDWEENTLQNIEDLVYAKNLKELYLNYYQSQLDLSVISEIKTLEFFGIHGLNVSSSTILNIVKELPNLISLNLDSWNSEIDVAQIANIKPNLEKLDIASGNFLNLSSLSDFSNLKSLSILDRSYNITNMYNIIDCVKTLNIEDLHIGCNMSIYLGNIMEGKTVTKTYAEISPFLADIYDKNSVLYNPKSYLETDNGELITIDNTTKTIQIKATEQGSQGANIYIQDSIWNGYIGLWWNTILEGDSEEETEEPNENLQDNTPIIKFVNTELKQYLLNNSYDINNDGEISEYEMSLVNSIYGMSGNRISGKLDDLKYATNLEYLDYTVNDDVNDDISMIFTLQNLEHLSLDIYSNGSSTDQTIDLTKMSNLTKLREFSIYTNLNSNYSKLPKSLTRLRICTSNSNKIDVSEISNLSNLSLLELRAKEINNIQNINKLTNLTDLTLQQTLYNVSSEDDPKLELSELENLINLESLRIVGNIQSIQSLKKIPNLKTLSLSITSGTNINMEEMVSTLNDLQLENLLVSGEFSVDLGTISSNNSQKDIKMKDLCALTKAIYTSGNKLYIENPQWDLSSSGTIGSVVVGKDYISLDTSYIGQRSISLITKTWNQNFSGSIRISYNVVENGDKEKEINIPDENLKKALLENYDLDKNGKITEYDMFNINYLYIEMRNIESIEGLQYLKNVETIRMPNNKIADLTPIVGLKKLRYADFRSNYIQNIDCLKNAEVPLNRFLLEDNYINLSKGSDNYNLLKNNYIETMKQNETTAGYVEDEEILEQIDNYIVYSQHCDTFENRTKEVKMESALKQKLIDLGVDKDNNNIITQEELYRIREKINVLDLSNLGIKDISPLKYINVYSIDLNNNNITDISALKNTKFVKINLSKNKISDISILKYLYNANDINLSDNNISNIKVLAEMPYIKYSNIINLNSINILLMNNYYSYRFDFSSNYIDVAEENNKKAIDAVKAISGNSLILDNQKEKSGLTGDVNGDNKVSLLDYGLVLSHVKRKKLLTGDMLVRADVNGDNKVSLLDYGLILAHVKRTKLLF